MATTTTTAEPTQTGLTVESLLRKGCVLSLALVGAASPLALSADIDYELRAGAAYSDNVERSSTNKVESAVAVAGLKLQGARDKGRLQFAVSGDGSYVEYLDAELPGEFIGSFFAESSYDIMPETLSWDLDGSFSQVREDLLRTEAPGNRSDVLSVSTGPTLRARFGGSLEAEWTARYSKAEFSGQDFDNDTVGTQLVVGHRFSTRSIVGVGASFSDVQYDSPAGLGSVDFERVEVFARARAEGVRTTLRADVGYAQAQGASIDDGGALIRFELTRRLSPFLSAYVVYAREYPTAQAAVFIPFDATGGGESGDASILTAAPRLAKNAELGLRLTRPRTLAELSYGRRSEIGLIDTFGARSFDTARISATRSLTPRSSATASAFLSREELSLVPGISKETGGGVAFNFNFGRRFGLDLRVDYRERNSPVVISEFSELSAGLFLRWGRIEPRGP